MPQDTGEAWPQLNCPLSIPERRDKCYLLSARSGMFSPLHCPLPPRPLLSLGRSSRPRKYNFTFKHLQSCSICQMIYYYVKLTCFQFIFFCLSVKEIAESVSRDRLYLHSAHALQLQIPTILKWADNKQFWKIWIGGRTVAAHFLQNFDSWFKFSEIKMSQLVSAGDSIKIWDTSTYDCDYCFESPGCHYTSNS